MKTQVVLAILAFIALSTPAQSLDRHYCGPVLSEMLVRYCGLGTADKRSDSWMRAQLFGAGYWLAPQQAVAMRGKRQSGIATQCCENTCTMSELLLYCPE